MKVNEMQNWWKRPFLGGLLLVAACAPTPPAPLPPIGQGPNYGPVVFDVTPPNLPDHLTRPAVLVFSKTNGFRHRDTIPAANAVFEQIARERGWDIYFTENGAIANPRLLRQFDVVVFNSVSGDVFSSRQRQALRDYVERGGGFVGIHGSGGDRQYAWAWYAQNLIGAQFIGHPLQPHQFQQVTVQVEDRSHAATHQLPARWTWTDELYSFARTARQPGYHVLATFDEKTYMPGEMGGAPLAMGADHPVIWWHCVSRGRAFYSALGHRPEAYADLAYRQVLEGAIAWASHVDGEGCN